MLYLPRGPEGRIVGRLRISIVEFLNTAPLVWGFTDGPQAGKYDLSFTVPSQCAEALKHGEVDVAIIPAIEYQRMDNVVALPGMAVAADGEVRSLLVVSKKPIERVKRIALDTSSRATVALVKMLAPGLLGAICLDLFAENGKMKIGKAGGAKILRIMFRYLY